MVWPYLYQKCFWICSIYLDFLFFWAVPAAPLSSRTLKKGPYEVSFRTHLRCRQGPATPDTTGVDEKTKIVVWNCHRHSQKKNLIETNVRDSKLRSPGGNPTPHSSDVFALCVAWIFLSYLRCIGLCTICSSVLAFYFILYSAPPLPMATHQARKENFEQTCHSWWSTRWPEPFGKTSPGRNTNPRHDVCTSNFQVLWFLSGLGLVRGWQVGSSFRSFFPSLVLLVSSAFVFLVPWLFQRQVCLCWCLLLPFFFSSVSS